MIFLSEIDECKSSPCKNGATCANSVNGYICSCVTGFTGTNCEKSEFIFSHSVDSRLSLSSLLFYSTENQKAKIIL